MPCPTPPPPPVTSATRSGCVVFCSMRARIPTRLVRADMPQATWQLLQCSPPAKWQYLRSFLYVRLEGRGYAGGRGFAVRGVMLARLSAAAVLGVEAVPVSVEVDVSPGLPGLTMVGLP